MATGNDQANRLNSPKLGSRASSLGIVPVKSLDPKSNTSRPERFAILDGMVKKRLFSKRDRCAVAKKSRKFKLALKRETEDMTLPPIVVYAPFGLDEHLLKLDISPMRVDNDPLKEFAESST